MGVHHLGHLTRDPVLSLLCHNEKEMVSTTSTRLGDEGRLRTDAPLALPGLAWPIYHLPDPHLALCELICPRRPAVCLLAR